MDQGKEIREFVQKQREKGFRDILKSKQETVLKKPRKERKVVSKIIVTPLRKCRYGADCKYGDKCKFRH